MRLQGEELCIGTSLMAVKIYLFFFKALVKGSDPSSVLVSKLLICTSRLLYPQFLLVSSLRKDTFYFYSCLKRVDFAWTLDTNGIPASSSMT
jgi:hypothetical protein